jgi:hypothetical protein
VLSMRGAPERGGIVADTDSETVVGRGKYVIEFHWDHRYAENNTNDLA